MNVSLEERRAWIKNHAKLSTRRQCELLAISRAGLYYEPALESEENLMLMRLIDEQYMRTPFYGSRKLTAWLIQRGHNVNRKRVSRLMGVIGVEAIYQKPRTSVMVSAHQKYPYLLSNLAIVRPNQVWSTDITYIRMRQGFLYLVAIIDWYSRYVLAWELSNTLDTQFCLDAIDHAFKKAKPEIFNSDQGCQFTSQDFTKRVKDAGVRMSMDGRGRAFDNIFVERFWRTVKYEEVYIKDYIDVASAQQNLDDYMTFYNDERIHQALDYQTPKTVHFGSTKKLESGVEKESKNETKKRKGSGGFAPATPGRGDDYFLSLKKKKQRQDGLGNNPKNSMSVV